VELSTDDPMEINQIAVTDVKGFAMFPDAPPGALRLVVSADGFVTAGLAISDGNREGIELRLSRGYRIAVSVELPAEFGAGLIRVANETGTPMERLLDSASDRRVEPPGRLSLGPLAPGVYVIELHGRRERRQERVRVIDGDASVVFR